MIRTTMAVKELLTAQVLEQCASRYDVKGINLQPLSAGVENVIYQFEKAGKEYVLRITPSSHRSVKLMQAEVDWISFLHRGGASVPQPLRSVNDQLIEKIELTDSYLLITASEKAPGGPVQEKDWNESLFYQWGKLQGRIHRLTQSYQVYADHKRYVWYEEDFISRASDYLPQDDAIVLEKYAALVEKIRELPQDKDTYGLTHADFHSTNFYVNKGSITVFEFDDCCYHYFINDIACAVFSAVKKPWSGENKQHFNHFFMQHYLQGYREEYDLEPYWLTLLPDFLKLREMIYYTVIYRSFDLDKLDPQTQQFLAQRKELIEQDIPCMNLTAKDYKV